MTPVAGPENPNQRGTTQRRSGSLSGCHRALVLPHLSASFRNYVSILGVVLPHLLGEIFRTIFGQFLLFSLLVGKIRQFSPESSHF